MNFKNLKYHVFVIKHYLFLVFVTTVEVKMEKIFKEEESTEILKNFILINNMQNTKWKKKT